jgi:hypothetical protein
MTVATVLVLPADASLEIKRSDSFVYVCSTFKKNVGCLIRILGDALSISPYRSIAPLFMTIMVQEQIPPSAFYDLAQYPDNSLRKKGGFPAASSDFVCKAHAFVTSVIGST